MLLIKNMWIGNSPIVHTHRDLQYGSTAWPMTVIHRILWACNNLRSLYIVDLDQNQWYRLQNDIPASLEHLAMGPVHGPFFINNLMRHPRIRHFTSAQTFMGDDEVQEIVLFPHMRQFRRIVDFDSRNTLSVALKQASCISKSKTLEEMQLLMCGNGQHDEAILKLKAKVQYISDDKRIIIQSSQAKSWLDLLCSEFVAETEVFIRGCM
ncbi:hypothetical protein L208DRAFT_1435535 [Tricholoma matsutake]|nr:hypothetical protein L208DRAFT_1435535 [Tricholoma matsutake 945]